MKSPEENGYRELARMLQAWAAVHAPDWTDENDSDPATAILALLAFLTEGFDALSHAIPERGRRHAARLARAALALADGKSPEQACTLARNNYFAGRLLGAEDFQLEQDYVRERLRRHNRALHGAGIVRGLQVSVRPDGTGQRVVVQPGLAIAPDGEEIEVRCEASIDLPQTPSELFVTLSHAECLTHPAPALDDMPVQYKRIEETFALDLEPIAGENAIALARLIRTADGWTVGEAVPAPCAIPKT